MVTMRDMAQDYCKRYYGKSFAQGLVDMNEKYGSPIADGTLDHVAHDCCHVVASGVAALKLPKTKEATYYFKHLDDKGLIDRNVGIKAESVQEIYRRSAFWGKPTTVENIREDFETNLVRDFRVYLNKNNGDRLSHIPPLDTLLKSYRNMIDDPRLFEKIFAPREIEFHIQKATELGKKLRAEHPECFENNKPNFEKILQLESKAFAVDNFFSKREQVAVRGCRPSSYSFER